MSLSRAQSAQYCPTNITMISGKASDGQVGSALYPFGIEFTTNGSTSETIALSKKNCQFNEFKVNSILPNGLTFDSSSGRINGTPTAQGGPYTISFSATVTENGIPKSVSGTRTFTIFAAGALTCSNVGAGGGCNDPTKPYSCTNSAFCFSSCGAASECGY
ncbi:Ig domain-containing protein [Leptospira ainazelensis]|uniref:Ig domain-containing protein n=1 Tax=Leptospira ainazelensis TaxID=2810034 RepID=UPI001E4B34C8|nr:Ig domain-containing protein [Leptospira ainazelensis]